MKAYIPTGLYVNEPAQDQSRVQRRRVALVVLAATFMSFLPANKGARV